MRSGSCRCAGDGVGYVPAISAPEGTQLLWKGEGFRTGARYVPGFLLREG